MIAKGDFGYATITARRCGVRIISRARLRVAMPSAAAEGRGPNLALLEEADMARTTGKTRKVPERDRYFDLVRKFPLRSLRSDDDLARAIGVIDTLIVRGDLDDGKQDYLDILTNTVEKYEDDEHPMSPVSDSAMLRHLIEARGITQSKLAADARLDLLRDPGGEADIEPAPHQPLREVFPCQSDGLPDLER
jgi:hypothetical protein